MKSAEVSSQIKLQSKRNVELWIYSFADMYMILSVFFIALSVLYAAKVKTNAQAAIASAGRGPSSVSSELQINFPTGSSTLNSETEEELKLLLPALKSAKTGFVEVEGYSDPTPLKKDSGFSSNLDLSNKRAVSVSEWLLKNGVAARRIRTYAYGDGRTWDTKITKTNRRVVVKIVNYEDKL